MRKFDLEAAKRGEPIQTRDGRAVKFVAHVPNATVQNQRLVVLHDSGYLGTYCDNGTVYAGLNRGTDLFMAPRKRTVWINFYPDGDARYYESEDKAARYVNPLRIGGKAYPVEIEE